MTGDILVRLVNVTKYFRDNALGIRILNSDDKLVEVNNVTIHLYRGETLGIIGLPGSGKSIIGKLISKVIEPSSGKVRNNNPTFLASHNHLFAAQHSVSQMIETIMLTYNIPLADFPERKVSILQFAELTDKEKEPFDSLSIGEKSQLLIALTYFLKPEVVIYDDLAQHLDAHFKDKFKMVIDLLMYEEKAIVLIEEQLDIIPSKANYLTWMSHGQVRKSGKPSVVIAAYKDYLKQLAAVRNQRGEELFDLDYKMRRKTLGQDNVMKRVARHTKSFLDEDFKKLLFLTLMLLGAGALMCGLIFSKIGYLEKPISEQETVIKTKKAAFTDKYAFAVLLKDDVLLDNDKKIVTLPAGTMVSVSGYNNNDFRIDYNSKQLTMSRSHALYINPAALYDDHTFGDLENYMYGNYANFREFFNSFLGKSHSVINKDLFPESNNRYKIKLTKNDIYLYFDDHNKMNAISFPIENPEGLKKKFQIKDPQWIVKIGDNYAVADFSKKMWYYYQL